MSDAVKQKTDKAEKADALMVAEYLLKHPDFLIKNPDLFTQLQLKHLHAGGAVSLIEKQVEKLRTENKRLHNQLDNLVKVARQNEQLSNHLHGLASNLLETRSISDVLALTEDVMRDVFKIDFVAMRMLSDVTDDMLLVIDEESESDLFAEFFTLNQPVCGTISREHIAYFFKSNMQHIYSAAMVPLKSTQHLGVLALGSIDPNRFAEDKGTIFLSHIGDLVSSALIAHL